MSKIKYLQGATFVLKWAVLYPIDTTNSPIKKILYFLWATYFISTLLITGAQCLIKLILDPFDLVAETMLIMNSAIYLTLLMNFIIFFYYSKNMVSLVTNINEHFLRESDNGVEDISMEFYGNFTNKLAVYFTISMMGSAFYTGVSPLFLGNRSVPVAGWFPYDYTKSPLYEISCAWQLLCQINLGIMYGCTDIIYPTMTMVVGHQFKIVASNLKNSFYYALRESGVPEETVKEFKTKVETENLFILSERYKTIFKIMNLPEFHQVNINYFTKNVQHHRLLLSYCDDLNQVMALFLMTKVVAAFFNLTMIAFSAITTGAGGVGTYVFFGFAQIFAYTFGGQILTESADFLWSLYEAPWYFGDLRYQKLFLVVQMNVRKMIYTKAANCFPMVAPMFITLLRGIFSYVTLLRQLGTGDA